MGRSAPASDSDSSPLTIHTRKRPSPPDPQTCDGPQTTCTMTPREKFTPEGAVLSQVLAGNSHPGASVLRVWQFGILKPQTTIRYAIVCYSSPVTDFSVTAVERLPSRAWCTAAEWVPVAGRGKADAAVVKTLWLI